MYVELKSGYNDDGPAWISRVYFSKAGQTVYFYGKTLRHAGGGLGPFNHVDVETLEGPDTRTVAGAVAPESGV
jgi:hypothetical protein